MATDTEKLVYMIFHLIRLILNLSIFTAGLLFIIGGCCHRQIRSSKQQWIIFNICIAAMIFAIINSVFAMLTLAPTYLTVIAAQVCMLQHYLEDVAQGQVAYSLVTLCIHQMGPQEWRTRSFLWFGICVIIQWSCSYLLPLPQILMSNVYICFAFFPNQFFVIYSVAFLLALPVFLHLMIYIIMHIFKLDRASNTQIYPAGQTDPIGIDHQLLMKYILLMGLLFAIIGYGPRGLLGVIDYKLLQSIALYAALEDLPSICLLINIGLLYKIDKEVRKNLKSLFKCS